MTALRLTAEGDLTEVPWPVPGSTNLKSMYSYMDCDTVDVIRLGDVDMWIDDEGKLRDPAAVNVWATHIAVREGALFMGDWVAGTVLFTGHQGPETISLTTDQIADLQGLLT